MLPSNLSYNKKVATYISIATFNISLFCYSLLA